MSWGGFEQTLSVGLMVPLHFGGGKRRFEGGGRLEAFQEGPGVHDKDHDKGTIRELKQNPSLLLSCGLALHPKYVGESQRSLTSHTLVVLNQEPLNAPFLNGLFSRGFSRGKMAH